MSSISGFLSVCERLEAASDCETRQDTHDIEPEQVVAQEQAVCYCLLPLHPLLFSLPSILDHNDEHTTPLDPMRPHERNVLAFRLAPVKDKAKASQTLPYALNLLTDAADGQAEPYPSEASTLSASSELSEPIEDEPLLVEVTNTVLFGRKTASPLILAQYDADRFIPLKGKNASRVSAVVRNAEIEVLGLNGLLLNGVKLEKGQKATLSARAELDFFGSKVVLTIPVKAEAPETPKEEPLSEPEEKEEPQVDIEGLLISSIVFASRSTVPISEILPSLPPSVASLPLDTLLDSLRNGPFGVIENPELKNASGKQLEPHFYYLPTQDTDKSRAESMKMFVKPVRKSQLQAKRYCWPKPVMKKR